MAVLLLVALAAASLVEPTFSLSRRVLRNYNEGWNAYWADIAASGGQLYPPPGARISNNYPPLSFYVGGWLGKILGDTLLAGRLVSLLSFVVVTLNIGLWLHRTGASVIASLTPSLAFATSMYAFAPDYIGMYDPQWLGHALMTTALVVIWGSPVRHRNVLGALALMVSGGWVKHLLVPLPVATTAYLAWRSRRALGVWLVGAALLLLGLFVSAHLYYGSDFMSGLLGTLRTFSWKRSFRSGFRAATALTPLWALAPLILGEASRSDRARFVVVYMIASGVTAILAAGGVGVSQNAFFDFSIAASLATGIAIDRLAIAGHTSALLVVALLTSLHVPAVTRLVRQLPTLESCEAATREDVRFIRSIGASGAACEDLLLCYWAGAPFNVDFFNFSRKLKTGALPPSECLKPLSEKAYTVIQLPTPVPPRSVLPDYCNTAIREHYALVRTSVNGGFLLPKGFSNTKTTPPADTALAPETLRPIGALKTSPRQPAAQTVGNLGGGH